MQRRHMVQGALAVGCGLAFVSWWRGQHSAEEFPRQLESDFRQHAGLSDDWLSSPERAFAALISFTDAVKYPHESGPYGDTLLFEYGVADVGQKSNFEFSLTRQVVFAGGSAADADAYIIQLRVLFQYAPDAFRQLKPMTQWKEDLPAGTSMLDFIQQSQAYPLVTAHRHRAVAVEASAQ